jgi:hypothetical protein
VHALLANDLADAMSISTVPVVLGGGKELFADGSAFLQADHIARLEHERHDGITAGPTPCSNLGGTHAEDPPSIRSRRGVLRYPSRPHECNSDPT